MTRNTLSERPGCGKHCSTGKRLTLTENKSPQVTCCEELAAAPEKFFYIDPQTFYFLLSEQQRAIYEHAEVRKWPDSSLGFCSLCEMVKVIDYEKVIFRMRCVCTRSGSRSICVCALLHASQRDAHLVEHISPPSFFHDHAERGEIKEII